jgi:hypothetical protein
MLVSSGPNEIAEETLLEKKPPWTGVANIPEEETSSRGGGGALVLESKSVSSLKETGQSKASLLDARLVDDIESFKEDKLSHATKTGVTHATEGGTSSRRGGRTVSTLSSLSEMQILAASQLDALTGKLRDITAVCWRRRLLTANGSLLNAEVTECLEVMVDETPPPEPEEAKAPEPPTPRGNLVIA